MTATLDIRNESESKRLYRRDTLQRLANRICDGERVDQDLEISVLFCDDDVITELNRQYRRKNAPTDVLSFEQDAPPMPGPRPLGDIVISLETAERNCGGDRECTRREVKLLFCHGLLHLLGYDHATKAQREQMQRKQAQYLDLSERAAWNFGPKTGRANQTESIRTPHGGTRSVGRRQ